MGIFDKLFGSKKGETKRVSENPNNDKLTRLLENYGRDSSQGNYKKALDEIVDGNSLLILPSINDGNGNDEWQTIQKDSTLKLTSVFNQDGLKVLGAFTTPEKLLEWSQKETAYTALKSKDVIAFCQTHGIDRIVIDSDLPTMFVLERSTANVKTETIQEKTEVQVGTPTHPISGQHLIKFQQNFSKINVIKEVYQYAMLRNNESILVLGFLLDTYTENSRIACIHSIQNSMEGEALELPLEMFMLDDEGWLQTVKGIEDALIYSR